MTSQELQVINKLTIAIQNSNLIEFQYKERIRIVEPYLIGELNDKHKNFLEEGRYALRAWFVSGYSSSPTDINQGDRWRIYHINDITELTILEEKNEFIRPLYDTNDKAFKRINYRVEIKYD